LATVKLVSLNADAVWTLRRGPTTAHPYLLVGVGVYGRELDPLHKDTKGAFNLGGGVQFRLYRKLSGYTEARFVSIRASGGATKFIPISAGLRFGGS
jgi:hypothetical protein